MTKLKFIAPASGDWVVVIDEETGNELYEGHGGQDMLYWLLSYLDVSVSREELPDEVFEDRYC